jgi:hypothetical protein
MMRLTINIRPVRLGANIFLTSVHPQMAMPILALADIGVAYAAPQGNTCFKLMALILIRQSNRFTPRAIRMHALRIDR